MHQYAKDLLSCTGNLLEKKNLLKKLIVNKNTKIARENLYNIYSKFSKKYPKVNFFLDLTESNYFDYHTGTRFTIFAKNVRGEVARGGRYISSNDLISKNSTGFTCYMDTIIRASSFTERINKILIPFETKSKLKRDLIKKGFIIDTYFGNSKTIKKVAIKKKINAYLFNNKIVYLEKK